MKKLWRSLVVLCLALVGSVVLSFPVHAQEPVIKVIPDTCHGAERFIAGEDYAIWLYKEAGFTPVVVENIQNAEQLSWMGSRIYGKEAFKKSGLTLALSQECRDGFGDLAGWWNEVQHYVAEYSPTPRREEFYLENTPPPAPANFFPKITGTTNEITVTARPDFETVRIKGGTHDTWDLIEAFMARRPIKWRGDRHGQLVVATIHRDLAYSGEREDLILYFWLVHAHKEQRTAVFGPFWLAEQVEPKMPSFIGFVYGNTISVWTDSWEEYIIVFEVFRRTMWIYPG